MILTKYYLGDSRIMIWAGHVARMGDRIGVYGKIRGKETSWNT